MPLQYSAEASAVAGAGVLLEPNEEDQTERAVGGGGQNGQLGGSAKEGRSVVRSWGSDSVRNIDTVRVA